MTRESCIALVGNATLLLALVYVYDLLNVLRGLPGTWKRQVAAGLSIGAVGFWTQEPSRDSSWNRTISTSCWNALKG